MEEQEQRLEFVKQAFDLSWLEEVKERREKAVDHCDAISDRFKNGWKAARLLVAAIRTKTPLRPCQRDFVDRWLNPSDISLKNRYIKEFGCF